jgi:hypothetical protein
MRFMLKAAAAAGLLALAACGGKGDDSLAANVEDNADAVADNIDAVADNVSNEAVQENLEDKADAVREAGEQKADAIDDSDVNAQALNKQ